MDFNINDNVLEDILLWFLIIKVNSMVKINFFEETKINLIMILIIIIKLEVRISIKILKTIIMNYMI